MSQSRQACSFARCLFYSRGPKQTQILEYTYVHIWPSNGHFSKGKLPVALHFQIASIQRDIRAVARRINTFPEHVPPELSRALLARIYRGVVNSGFRGSYLRDPDNKVVAHATRRALTAFILLEIVSYECPGARIRNRRGSGLQILADVPAAGFPPAEPSLQIPIGCSVPRTLQRRLNLLIPSALLFIHVDPRLPRFRPGTSLPPMERL